MIPQEIYIDPSDVQESFSIPSHCHIVMKNKISMKLNFF